LILLTGRTFKQADLTEIFCSNRGDQGREGQEKTKAKISLIGKKGPMLKWDLQQRKTPVLKPEWV
jgi:hypothetical protein